MRRVAKEITGEAIPRPEFDEALDDAARWLGARLGTLREPDRFPLTEQAKETQRKRSKEESEIVRGALETLREKGLVKRL